MERVNKAQAIRSNVAKLIKKLITKLFLSNLSHMILVSLDYLQNYGQRFTVLTHE